MAAAQTLFGSMRKHKVEKEDGTCKIEMAIPVRKTVKSGPVVLRDFFKLTGLPMKEFRFFKKLVLTYLQLEIMKPGAEKVIVGYEMEMNGDGDDHIHLATKPIYRDFNEIIAEQEGRIVGNTEKSQA